VPARLADPIFPNRVFLKLPHLSCCQNGARGYARDAAVLSGHFSGGAPAPRLYGQAGVIIRQRSAPASPGSSTASVRRIRGQFRNMPVQFGQILGLHRQLTVGMQCCSEPYVLDGNSEPRRSGERTIRSQHLRIIEPRRRYVKCVVRAYVMA
jgi:hypothetical protein